MRGAYARNWSLDDGGTEEKGRWLPISMRCWRAGPSTWSFVPAHQDTSTVATPGFMSVPRAFQQERDKNWASRRSSWKEERGRLMLRGFVVLFILLWSSFWAAESDPRSELIRHLPKLPTSCQPWQWRGKARRQMLLFVLYKRMIIKSFRKSSSSPSSRGHVCIVLW